MESPGIPGRFIVTLTGLYITVYEPAGNVDSWRAVGDEPLVVFVTLRGAIEYLDEHGDVIRRSTAMSAADCYRRGVQ